MIGMLAEHLPNSILKNPLTSPQDRAAGGEIPLCVLCASVFSALRCLGGMQPLWDRTRIARASQGRWTWLVGGLGGERCGYVWPGQHDQGPDANGNPEHERGVAGNYGNDGGCQC
jgi:hypothetical protein